MASLGDPISISILVDKNTTSLLSVIASALVEAVLIVTITASLSLTVTFQSLSTGIPLTTLIKRPFFE